MYIVYISGCMFGPILGHLGPIWAQFGPALTPLSDMRYMGSVPLYTLISHPYFYPYLATY